MMSFTRKLRTLLVTAAALSAAGAAWATPDWNPQTILYKGRNITIELQCRTHTSVDSLHYKSMLANLDAFADSLKRSGAGKLSLGKIHFFLELDAWNSEITSAARLYSAEDGYHCVLNRYYQPARSITQYTLTMIIAYFASDKWKPFCCDNCYDKQEESRAALRAFNNRVYKTPVSHIYESKKVLDVNGGIAVYFQDAALVCKSADKVYGKIDYALPFAAGAKTFITVGDTVLVVEGGAEVSRYVLKFETLKSAKTFRTKISPKSVDFRSDLFSANGSYTGADAAFLRYSIEENKFSTLKGEWVED
ncbi:hypothetical protein R80B4_02174 [Fibrobacteres bacterium R8-0-B4]